MLLLIKFKTSLKSHEKAVPSIKRRRSPERCVGALCTGSQTSGPGATSRAATVFTGAGFPPFPRLVFRGQHTSEMQPRTAFQKEMV